MECILSTEIHFFMGIVDFIKKISQIFLITRGFLQIQSNLTSIRSGVVQDLLGLLGTAGVSRSVETSRAGLKTSFLDIFKNSIAVMSSLSSIVHTLSS
jgi:hypothetical protein